MKVYTSAYNRILLVFDDCGENYIGCFPVIIHHRLWAVAETKGWLQAKAAALSVPTMGDTHTSPFLLIVVKFG